MDDYNKACLSVAGLGFAGLLAFGGLTADAPKVPVEQDITPPAIERTVDQYIQTPEKELEMMTKFTDRANDISNYVSAPNE